MDGYRKERKRKMKKQAVCFMMGLFVAAGVLTGCGGKDAGGDSGSASGGGAASGGDAADGASGGDTADGTGGGDAADGASSAVVWTNLENEAKVLQEYAKKFEEETGNSVEVIHETADIQQFAQAVKSADGPDGIYGIANDQLANYIDAGLVQEVPGDVYQDGDYTPAAVQACYAQGKRYGVPIAVETNALFYNTEKIAEVPESWEELLEVAKENGGIQFEATSIYYDLGFLRAYDGYIFQYRDGNYDTEDIGLGNDGAVKAYEFINRLAADYQFVTSDITSDTAKSNFQNGVTAFYIGGPWDIDGLNAAGTPFAVAPVPKLNGKDFVTPVGTQIGFVSSKSDSQNVVWEFYKYLAENSAKDLYDAGGRIPAALSALDAIEKDAATESFVTQITYGEPMPTASELGQVWTPFSDNMKLMLNGQVTPQEAAEYIKSQVAEGISMMNSGK